MTPAMQPFELVRSVCVTGVMLYQINEISFLLFMRQMAEEGKTARLRGMMRKKTAFSGIRHKVKGEEALPASRFPQSRQKPRAMQAL